MARQRGALHRRVTAVTAVVVFAGLLLGCLPSTAPGMSTAAYVTDHNGSQLFQFGVGAGGLLSALTPPMIGAGVTPEGVAVSPDARSVYVANPGAGNVSQYDVGAGGVLSAKTPATVPSGSGAAWVAVSPDGKSVYVTNAVAGNVAQFDVGAGGVLSAKTPPTVPTSSSPSGVAVSPDGKSVYVADSGKAEVSQYDVAADGSLTHKKPATVLAGAAPRGVAVSPDGRNLYVANHGGTVSQYDIGADGTLSPKTPATVPAGNEPERVAVSPDGKSVYVTDDQLGGGGEGVSQYTVGAGGALSPMSPAIVQTFGEPIGVTLSADGASLYVANLHGYVSQFDVGAGGLLAAKTPATVPAGTGPPAEPDGHRAAPRPGAARRLLRLPCRCRLGERLRRLGVLRSRRQRRALRLGLRRWHRPAQRRSQARACLRERGQLHRAPDGRRRRRLLDVAGLHGADGVLRRRRAGLERIDRRGSSRAEGDRVAAGAAAGHQRGAAHEQALPRGRQADGDLGEENPDGHDHPVRAVCRREGADRIDAFGARPTPRRALCRTDGQARARTRQEVHADAHRRHVDALPRAEWY